MLSIGDLKLVISILTYTVDDSLTIPKEFIDNNIERIDNLIERLKILVAQDKKNREYQEEMTKYRDRLNELVKNDEEPIEK